MSPGPKHTVGTPAALSSAASVHADIPSIDGSTRWRTFLQIILPLSRPALVTLALLAFLTNWNDFLLPLFVLFSPESLTLPPGLGLLQGSYTTSYEIIMAGAVVATLPALILFIVAQRFVIEGVSATGIKG